MAALVTAPAQAQTIVLKRNVTADTTNNSWGANRRHYASIFMALDTYAGIDQDGLRGTTNNSIGFTFGIRYKLQYSSHVANVFDLTIASQNFGFNRSSYNVVFPDAGNYNHEAFRFGVLGLSGAFRFNYGKRGETLGRYFDLGAGAGWVIEDIHFTSDYDANNRKFETSTYRNDYVNNFIYYAQLRVGFGHLALMANYRISDYFKATSYAPKVYELPRLRAGVEICF